MIENMIGLASSVPQFNLNEVNNALIHLIQNPDCDFEDIYCAPDFATGAILLNEEEVKESLRNGTGSACKLRSVVSYDSKERCFIVTEIPYGVYTSTICGELDSILEDENNPGIDKYNDLTGKTPLLKIYLSRRGNPDRVLKYLFKNTSLQSWYSINMTMLDNGRYPKVFGWKEALQAHIEHEKEVYRNSFNFDLNKMKTRVHILDGLLICLASIDEVVAIIKKSKSTVIAKDELCTKFLLDEEQTKAVLDLKLSRLAHLEVEKLKNEREDLLAKIAEIERILNTEELFNNELIKGWRAVAEKFGDSRRTQILNVETENSEPTEKKTLQIALTNRNNLFVSETSTLYIQRRGGVGSKIKLDSNEVVISTLSCENFGTILFFTSRGLMYSAQIQALPLEEKISAYTLFELKEEESLCEMISLEKKNLKKNILFVTKKGMIKKSLISEYNLKRNGGVKAMDLDSDDEIKSILFVDDERIGLVTLTGHFLICETKDITPIKRVTKGIKGIKLEPNDEVTNARIIPKNIREYLSISGCGFSKRTAAKEFFVQGRNTKGKKIQKLKDNTDYIADFLPIYDEKEVIITSTKARIKLTVNSMPISSRDTIGTKAIKIGEKDNVVKFVKP